MSSSSPIDDESAQAAAAAAHDPSHDTKQVSSTGSVTDDTNGAHDSTIAPSSSSSPDTPTITNGATEATAISSTASASTPPATATAVATSSSSPQVVVEHHWLTPMPHPRSVGSISATTTPSAPLPSSSSGHHITRSTSTSMVSSSSSIKAIPVVESMHGLSPTEKARRLIDQCLRAADDGVPLQHVSIQTTSVVGDVVFYEVIISNDNIRWTVLRRFNEFVELNTAIEGRVRVTYGLPPFPDKHWKIFTNHLDADFINVRRSILENYLKKILTIPKLRCCRPFLQFLTPCATDEVKALDFKDELFEPRDFDGLERDRKSSITRDMVEAARAYKNSRASVVAQSSPDGSPGGLTSSSSSSDDGTSPPPSHLDASTTSDILPPSSSSSPAPISSSSPPMAAPTSLLPSSTSESKEPAFLSASTEVTEVSIPAAQILKRNHVVYQINVFNIHKRKTYQQWTVLKRYVEFYKLDAAIRAGLTAANDGSVHRLPTLPTREIKMLVDHLQPRFIEKRRLILQVYLTKLITVPEAVARPELLEFLGCNS